MEKLAYKRLETDEEFITRIQKQYPWWKPVEPGFNTRIADAVLDYYAYEALGLQRKIVEVFP